MKETKDNLAHATGRVIFDGGNAFIETRIRPIGKEGTPGIPAGKVLVMRAPILPGASAEEIEAKTVSELVDDASPNRHYCPDCAADGGTGYEWMDQLPTRPIREETKVSRNEPCPCGSGRKYKKCCLLN